MCIFCKKILEFVQVEYPRVGGWYIVRTGGNPGAFIPLLLLISWIHAAMNLSYWPQIFYA